MSGRERLFFGVSLDPASALTVSARLAKLRLGRIPIRRVPETNLHLTTRFIGAAEPGDQDRIMAGIDHRKLPPRFAIRLTGWGAFPRPAVAKVVWVGVVDDGGGLHALHDVTNRAAVLAGFTAEDRPYKPHLTVGRLRFPADVRPALSTAAPIDVTMEVTRLTLFRSITGKGHPQYDPICSVSLPGHESLRNGGS